MTDKTLKDCLKEGTPVGKRFREEDGSEYIFNGIVMKRDQKFYDVNITHLFGRKLREPCQNHYLPHLQGRDILIE